jgi:hypothetical protein
MEGPAKPAWGLLIYNPASGTAAKVPPGQLLDALRESGDEVRLHEFVEGDDPSKIVHSALGENVKWIAVAGGDGTVEAAAAALIDAGIPLGIIPCGTYNNFALSASIPADPIEAARVVASGITRDVDVGFIGDRPFFECVGVGLDAALFPLGERIKSGAFTKTWEFLRRAAVYPFRTRAGPPVQRGACNPGGHSGRPPARTRFQPHLPETNPRPRFDDHRLERPVLRDELHGRSRRNHRRRLADRHHFQTLQQTAIVVALPFDPLSKEISHPGQAPRLSCASGGNRSSTPRARACRRTPNYYLASRN